MINFKFAIKNRIRFAMVPILLAMSLSQKDKSDVNRQKVAQLLDLTTYPLKDRMVEQFKNHVSKLQQFAEDNLELMNDVAVNEIHTVLYENGVIPYCRIPDLWRII